MKIAGVAMEGQNAKNVKNNTQTNKMPLANNRLLSKITRENYNNQSTIVKLLISGYASSV